MRRGFQLSLSRLLFIWVGASPSDDLYVAM